MRLLGGRICIETMRFAEILAVFSKSWGSRLSVRVCMALAGIVVICPSGAHALAGQQCVIESKRDFRYQDFSPSSIRILKPCSGGTRKAVVFVSYYSISGMSMYVGKEFQGLSPAARREQLEDRNAFLYDRLAEALAAKGYTTVQYDAIASGCQIDEVGTEENPFCVKTEETERILFSDFSRHLSGVLEESFRSLAQDSRHPIIFVALSGASKVVADFIEQHGNLYRGQPFGLLGISPLLGPGFETIRHQAVGFWISRFRKCQGSRFQSCATLILKDDVFRRNRTAEELRQLGNLIARKRAGNFTRIERVLDASRVRVEKIIRAAVFGPQESSNESIGGLIEPGRSVLARLFIGQDDTAGLLTSVGSTLLIFGENDSALSPQAQRSLWLRHGGSESQIRILPGLGHLLGSHYYSGPPAEAGYAAIIAGIEEVAANLSPRGYVIEGFEN